MTHRRRLPVLLLFVLLVVAGLRAPAAVAQDAVYPGATWERIDDPAASGYSAEALEEVRARAMDLSTTGFVAVLDGRILFEYGDIAELSYLASVRKSILAMLYGNHVEDGTIDLDRTLAELGMDDRDGLLPIERKATVRHLITARSGIYHRASNAGDNSADAPPRGSQEPGTYMLYNNWDFNAAGAAFEKMTGRNIYDAVEEDLARPLGFQDWDRSAQHKSGDLEVSKYPAYHMWISTRDMARIGHLMLRKGEWRGEQLVPRAWTGEIVRAVTPVEEMNPPRYRDREFGYGYMWWVWDGPEETGPFEGAYSARGAWGQYITVLPAVDLVFAHKTAVPPRRRTGWDEYISLVEGILDARCDGDCR